MTTTDWTPCPRCGVEMNPRDYPAISRTDDRTDVCSRCGIDEAIEAMMRGAPTPQAQWPIVPVIDTTLVNGQIILRRPIPRASR